MKKVFLILSLALLFAPAKAQRVLSIEDAVTFGKGSLFPKSLRGLNWVPDKDIYYHYATKEGKSCLALYDVQKKKADTITLEMINIGLKRYNNTVLLPGSHLPEIESFPSILGWKNSRQFRFYNKQVYFLYDITSHDLVAENGVNKGIANATIHDESGAIAYTQGQNVWVKFTGNLPVQVSFDSLEGVVNGTSVHRDEFGIHNGLFWSNDGRKLAYYRMDESMVTKYPIIDIDAMPATADYIRYPFAGQTSHQVTLWVYDSRAEKSIQIKTEGPVDQFLTNISWDPSGKYVYIAIVNRDQNKMELNRYNVATGLKEVNILEESHSKYVEPENQMYWIGKSKFVWQSEQDGYNHLYLYDNNGILIRQLTSGKWVVTDILGTDKKEEHLFFMATKQSPLNRNLYKVNLKSGVITEITKESGVHNCSVSSSGTWVLDQYTSSNVPGITQLIHASELKPIHLNKAVNPLKEYELGETRVFTIPSTDAQVDLYCRVIKPTNFDSTKKYPVVVYVYGGPHLQLINNSWLNGANLWMHYMAQQGYVVFSLDNRGSSNRGLEFENAVHRNLGTLEIEDQLAGVEWLKKQSYVDADRMAVHGWSFGGFMTIGLMTRTPGVFRVGVSGGPVIDWSMYEIMYTERYMDRPEENPEGFEKSNLLNYVANLDGKLMLIHGSSDDVVLWQHSLLYVREAVQKKVLIDYFVYPEHKHNVGGIDRVHLMRKVTEYIVDNLK